jgi:hypothetical protein
MELGPKLLRKPPRGWIPARAFPLETRLLADPPDAEGSSTSGIDTSQGFAVTWQLRVDGREPVEFAEERRGPIWIIPGSNIGNRWYKLRLRRSHGLLKSLGVPCFVDPADPTRLWIDWDAAYHEHVEGWERKRREERAEHERAVAAGRTATPDGEQAALAERVTHAQWLSRAGRKASAVVVSQAATGRTLDQMPVILITLDVEDGDGTRRVAYEHIWGRAHAEQYGVGKRIQVRVDPGDPERVELL